MSFDYVAQSLTVYQIILLSLLTAITLIFPFIIKIANDYIEIFFLAMGFAAVTISGNWSFHLIAEAAAAPVSVGSLPIGIFQVVFVFGLIIHYLNHKLYPLVTRTFQKLQPRLFLFVLILLLGLFSSVVSVIVTAVVLSEVLIVLPIKSTDKTRIAILTCFAIGLGAGLTPIGEPLSTILVYKLSGPPHNADFFFPLRNLGVYIIPGIILISIFGSLFIAKRISQTSAQIPAYSESLKTIIHRAINVYIFIFALILLGEGLKPLFELFLKLIPAWALYWINIISSFLDNATLTAIEINPDLQISQIISAVMALLISGGMLIPGNIPNIVAAGRLKINMRDWALTAVPVGLVLMILYFIALLPVFLG